ncbi:Ig-like domain-containing protein, partial [Photobacterium aquimaris]
VSISGVVGGDVKEGDVVTLTVDGKEIGTAIVEKNEAGDLVWTATGIDGATLANANLDQVTATVTATDDADNSVTVTNTHDYLEATLDAKVTITSVAGDNILTGNEIEQGAVVAITGTVGGDVKAGDTVVVTVDGVKHEVTVNDDLTWTLEVDGSVLANSKLPEVTADVIIKDNYGNTATDNDSDDYTVDIQASITIDKITGDNVITQQEGHEAFLPITGTVGEDVREGDTVTVTINGHEYQTTVKPDLTWEVEVTGNDILHADKATASVTTSYDTDKNVT